MRSKLSLLLLASALAGCSHAADQRDRGVETVYEPVLHRTDYVLDVAAPSGELSPQESARLDGWFRGLNLGYGDAVYVDGDAYGARGDVARVAGQYGLMVSAAAPVTAGPVGPGTVRVVVSRNRASVPGCAGWQAGAQPNYSNRMLPNFGCAVNGNMAMQVANPGDLVHGQAGAAASDGIAGAKAVQLYREWPLTAIKEGQDKRPLKTETTREED